MTFSDDLGVNEIHGTYGQDIDEDFARVLGQAIGTRLAGGRLVVGGDIRDGTPALKNALIDGVLSTGCEVYDVGVVPTPGLYFAKDRLWADGAVMVTGSHRSAAENGFKLTLGKLPSTEIELSELQQVIRDRGPFASGAGTLHTNDILEPYSSFLIARFIPADSLRVIVDCNHGSMSGIAPAVLRFMGYEVIEVHCTPDSDFGNRVPDPNLPENMSDLSRAVLAYQAQLGVAYDGDGDEVVFSDEQGTIMAPDQVLVLFAKSLLLYQPGSQVVYDATYAPFVADEILKVGGKPIMLDAGSAGLKRRLLEQGAVLGGDTRGHYFFRTMGGDDALYATMVMLRIASRYEGALAPVIADLSS